MSNRINCSFKSLIPKQYLKPLEEQFKLLSIGEQVIVCEELQRIMTLRRKADFAVLISPYLDVLLQTAIPNERVDFWNDFFSKPTVNEHLTAKEEVA